MATCEKAKFKKGDWVRATDQAMVDHWNNHWAERSGVIAKVGTPFKIETARPGSMSANGGYYAVSAGSVAEGPFWVGSQIEPWTPRVGERIRALVGDYGVTAGRVYEITDIDDDDEQFEFFEFIDDDGDNNWFSIGDIEPVTDTPADDKLSAEPKFKVGDRVRVVKADDSWWFEVGDVGEIANFEEMFEYQYRVKFDGCKSDGYVNDEHIELATTTPLKIEAGKFYMTRDGRKVGPMKPFNGAWAGDVENDESGRLFENDGKHGNKYIKNISYLDLIAESPAEAPTTTTLPPTTDQTDTAIVCLIRDGKPLPASAPYVHDDQRSASQEMRRLADLHKGDTFGVYQLTATCKQTKPGTAAGIDESAATADGGMTQTYQNITSRQYGKSAIKGRVFKLREECANDYYKERLPKIPAGTAIIADFAGDFGMYGMAEIDGAMHKVKVGLHELHKINFGEFDARAALTA